ncbi:MAG: bifunctional riboflavin kinase/FAD synthetase [Bacteroidia bacterium]|nr:bifunctional riboflavin kinase/FAD synthetase [Bacteroidia bacterium]MCF8425562.1 bifunctional riboflavin kinase/FAD synthetase [Bacteroidia bacterium]MCF8447476.1 bifunctional riboflavin kinase/FAD synthetase [Bacteroidia bacterium]
MKVYRSLEEFQKIETAIVTQGTFDGVHAAHQVILNQLKELAKQNGGETVLITYHPHPRMVLFPEDHGLHLLSTTEEKIKLLEDQGIDHLLILPFTKEFSRLSSLEFIRDILVNKIGTKYLVIGYNHRFGKNREGSFAHLKEFAPAYGFEVKEISEQDVDQMSVSSTKIREALKSGEVELAARFLGKPYSICGLVIEGRKLGRTIGYPTANVQINEPYKLIPQDGVYAVWVIINNLKYGGMLNIGNNPTIEGKGRSIEVHIFNFSESIYNQTISLQFVDKLRDEAKFANLDALKSQLQNDKLQSLKRLEMANN